MIQIEGKDWYPDPTGSGSRQQVEKCRKTDKEDAMKLAHLIEERRDEKLPLVPLPSEKRACKVQSIGLLRERDKESKKASEYAARDICASRAYNDS